MQQALLEAKKAFENNEVPVGCVIADSEGNIISRAHNLVEKTQNPNFHAEMIAIDEACKKLGSKNLENYDIYVTLEPCTMCASAIANSRITRLYYGALDDKHGAVENGVRFFTSKSCFHRPEIYSGIYAEESTELLKSFFSKIRKDKLYY